MTGVDLLAAVAALTTSVLLIASAVGHLRHRGVLGADLAAHGVLAPAARRLVALALPAVELVAGVAGVVTVRGPALAAQALLFAAFAGYLGLVVRAGRTALPCGCGLPDVPVGAALARAAALAALALLAALAADALPRDAGGLALVAVAAPTLALLIAVVPAARRAPLVPGAAS